MEIPNTCPDLAIAHERRHEVVTDRVYKIKVDKLIEQLLGPDTGQPIANAPTADPELARRFLQIVDNDDIM